MPLPSQPNETILNRLENLCRSKSRRRWCSQAVSPCGEHGLVIVSLLYKVTRKLLSVPSVVLRSETAKDAELLILRHENAILRRQLTGPVRYEPADRFWFAALSGVGGSSPLAEDLPGHAGHPARLAPQVHRS